MQARVENWLLKHWYGGSRPPWYLRMLEPVYRFGYQRAESKARRGSGRYKPRLPLVIVGNLTAGGAGKTPLVMRLCQLAVEMNLKPGIATTGYGRASRDTFVVHADSDPRLCGDEPLLLAQRTAVPVVVAADRLEAVKKLDGMDLDLLISDDGLQHPGLDRDIEFCVVDGERGLGNGHQIPAGPLRESPERLGQVDYVISNGEWLDKPGTVGVQLMRLVAKSVRSLSGTQDLTPEEFQRRIAGIPVHAVCAIGNPERFFRLLEGMGIRAGSQRFPDHHAYSRADFDSIADGSAIIMTEKDAVKCRSLELENAWYVPVETCLEREFEQTLKDRMAMACQQARS